jgi:hypothetical protein
MELEGVKQKKLKWIKLNKQNVNYYYFHLLFEKCANPFSSKTKFMMRSQKKIILLKSYIIDNLKPGSK